MGDLYEDLTTQERVAHLELEARRLVALAHKLDVLLKIDMTKDAPPIKGETRTVLDVEVVREPAVAMQPAIPAPDSRPKPETRAQVGPKKAASRPAIACAPRRRHLPRQTRIPLRIPAFAGLISRPTCARKANGAQWAPD